MDPSEYFILSLFIALGLFSIVAAICNFDWYFKTSGAMTFVNWFGRGGARLLCVVGNRADRLWGAGTYVLVIKSKLYLLVLVSIIKMPK